MTRDIPLPHPCEDLKEEFLTPMGLSVYALAKAIHAPRSRLNDICHGRQAITPWRRPEAASSEAMRMTSFTS